MTSKLLLSLIGTILLLTACSNKQSFTVTGSLSGKAETKDGTPAYLYADREGDILLDSTTVKAGKFTLKANPDKPSMGYIGMQIAEQYPMMLPVVLESGDVTLEMSEKITITGGTLNEKMQAQNNLIEEKFSEMGKKYREKLMTMTDESLEGELEDEIMEEEEAIINELLINFIKENIDNPVGTYFFTNSASMLDYDQLNSIITILPETAKADKEIADIISEVESTYGKPFTDIKGYTIDGKEAALSDYAGKGKIVLLDFWASWCGPCIAELPNVKKAYEEYKDKGFEIVGVSLDDNKDAWKKATEQHEIKWPQFSNLKGWDEDGAIAYSVKSIPHTILLDKDGKIIAKDLRGRAIAKKLKQLLD